MCRHLAWLGEPAHRRRAGARARARAAAAVLPAATPAARPAQRRRLGRRASSRPAGPSRCAGARRKPLWGDAVVRLGGAGAAAPAACWRRCAPRRSGCRWTRAPPRRSPTAAGCSPTTAGSTAPCCRLATTPSRCATPPSSPPTSSPRAPTRSARRCARSPPSTRRRRSTCCSPTAPGSSRSTWGDPLSYLVEPDGVVVASEPYDDDPRWVDVPDRHLLEVTRRDDPRRHRDRTGELMPTTETSRPPRPGRPGRPDGRSTCGPGLTATPKTLPPKYFYDARGSELFDEITRLPEYYPTRTERAILDAARRRHRAADRVRRRWSSSAAARRRRPGCCCGR